MKFQRLIEIFKERMAGVDVLPVLMLCFLGLIVLIFVLWRWGPGFLVALTVMFVGLMLVRSAALGGVALIARFPLAIVLSFFILSQKNKRPLTPVCLILGLLPLMMLLNSGRARNSADAFGQSIFYLLYYLGLILGGRKILGDARGRATFIRSLALYTIVMTCVQIPFFSSLSEQGRFLGAFENVIGIMTVGTFGVIILVWFGMRQKVWSLSFIFFMGFATLTLAFLILSGGRTALGSVAAGILVILSRKLKRNTIVILAASIIIVPMGMKIITSFPGLENVKGKIFSTVTSGRGALFAMAFNEMKQKPLLGWGTGEASVKSKIRSGMSYHNSYLELGVDHGFLFGLIMFILFAWLPLRGMLLMRNCQNEEMKDMANLSTALLTAYFLASLLGGVLTSTTGILLVYASIALQAGVYAEYKEMKRYGGVYSYDYDYNDEAYHEEYSWEQDDEQVVLEEFY